MTWTTTVVSARQTSGRLRKHDGSGCCRQSKLCVTYLRSFPHSGRPTVLLIFLSKRCQNFRPIGRLNASAEALKGQIKPFVLLDDFPHLLAKPKERLVGRGGLEPPTSRLSGVRSNHLSYRPLFVFLPGKNKTGVRQAICVSKSAESSTQWLCHRRVRQPLLSRTGANGGKSLS